MKTFEYLIESCDVSNIEEFLLRKGSEGYEAWAIFNNIRVSNDPNLFDAKTMQLVRSIDTYKVFFKREKDE